MQVRARGMALLIVLSVVIGPRLATAETPIHDSNGSLGPRFYDVTVPSPCPGPDCSPNDLYPDPLVKGHHIVFVQFDAQAFTKSSSYEDNAVDNVSWIITSSQTIPAFNRYDVGYSGTDAQARSYLINKLNGYAAAFDIEFVTSRPATSPYHMIKVGGTAAAVGEGNSVLGISTLDCGDLMSSNIAFAFSGNGNMSIDGLAVTMIHEMGHTMGLSHLDNQQSIMNPYVSEGVPVSFRNQVYSIPDGPGCGGATSENSYEVLMTNVGPEGQDVSGPTVVINSPLAGAFVPAGSQVTASISDPSGIDYAEMQVDSTDVGDLQSAPWTWTIPSDTPAGERMITVRAYDTKGNNSRARITVTITTGDETQCTGDEDCEGDLVCRGEICVPPGTPGVLGDPCEEDQDCATAVCATVGDEKRCTQMCDEENPCPDGFDCIGGCWPSGDDGGDDGGGGGGCAVGSVPSSDAGALVLLLGALWLGRCRRRRRD